MIFRIHVQGLFQIQSLFILDMGIVWFVIVFFRAQSNSPIKSIGKT